MNAIKLLFLISALFFSSQSHSVDRQPINSAIELQTYVYAAMASNAYTERPSYFPLNTIGWEKLDFDGSVITSDVVHTYADNTLGLAFDVWRKAGTNDIVTAFRGTDSKKDYFLANFVFISPQYKSAVKQFEKFTTSNPALRPIAFTGHSLGGGLALRLSLKHTLPAYTFNSSPRIFDGFLDRDRRREQKRNNAPERINIVQKGEILTMTRCLSTKFYDIVKTEFTTNYDFDGYDPTQRISAHSGYHLALHIIRAASTTSPEAAALLQAEHP